MAEKDAKPTSTRRVVVTRKAKVPSPTPAAIQVKRATIPSPPDLSPVSVHGRYADNVSVIPKTLASLHLVPGRLDADGDEKPRVLIPFAEMRLGGMNIHQAPEFLPSGDDERASGDGEDADPPTLFAANLPLENLAYVLLDLTSDLKRICGEVCAMSGELAVDPARMAHVRYFVAHLERQARQCRLRIDNKYGPPEE